VREFTPAELRVLEHMAQGHANSAIAECLVLSRRTVENQVRTIFTKLGLAQTTEVSVTTSSVVGRDGCDASDANVAVAVPGDSIAEAFAKGDRLAGKTTKLVP
jgi:DNA-binding CsgD family transcriptional regulator